MRHFKKHTKTDTERINFEYSLEVPWFHLELFQDLVFKTIREITFRICGSCLLPLFSAKIHTHPLACGIATVCISHFLEELRERSLVVIHLGLSGLNVISIHLLFGGVGLFLLFAAWTEVNFPCDPCE